MNKGGKLKTRFKKMTKGKLLFKEKKKKIKCQRMQLKTIE